MEVAAHGSDTASAFLKAAVWPSASWPREILLALAENDFAEVPQRVVCELLAWTETTRATK